MPQFKVERERDFHPHHILISAANTALDDAKAKRPGYLYYELTAIMFSALALEALANSFGDHLILRWKDYESSSPIAKLRIVCDSLRIVVDFDHEPWSTVLWLVKFRNKVAHAKPESIRSEALMSEVEFEAKGRDMPESAMEKEISLPNAERSVTAVESILEMLYGKLDPYTASSLLMDGWSGSTSRINDPPIAGTDGGAQASPT